MHYSLWFKELFNDNPSHVDMAESGFVLELKKHQKQMFKNSYKNQIHAVQSRLGHKSVIDYIITDKALMKASIMFL